jgi:hypothetical protein
MRETLIRLSTTKRIDGKSTRRSKSRSQRGRLRASWTGGSRNARRGWDGYAVRTGASAGSKQLIFAQSALETRGVIDRAIGIMMSRSGGTEDQALTRLRALSQNEHHKLAVVARQIIDDAVRRAQARRDSG